MGTARVNGSADGRRGLRRRTLLAAVSALAGAAGVLAGGAGQAGAQSAEPIRIGSFLSATGPASFLGEPEMRVLQLYVNRINREGGVLGRQLQLSVYDDGGAADKAASFTKRLIESDGVDVLLGGTTTAATMAAVPLVERAQVPFISLAGAVVIVDPVKTWVFKTPHTDRMAVDKVYADMKTRGFEKIALLSEDSGFGKSGREQALQAAKAAGLTVVADETYGAKDADVTPQLTKIRGAEGVQAVLVSGLGQGPAMATRSFRKLGLAMPLYHLHGVASKEFIRLAGAAAEGVRLPAAGLVVAAQLADSDPQKPVVTEFTKVYESTFSTEVSTFAGHAYDALYIYIDAVKRAGSTDKAKVRDAIEQTKGYIGTGGVVNMSATDHMGLGLDAFHMVEVKNGDWSLVK